MNQQEQHAPPMFALLEVDKKECFLLWEALSELSRYLNKMSGDLVDRGNLCMAGKYSAKADEAQARADYYLALYHRLG